jgi:hypothetical protein
MMVERKHARRDEDETAERDEDMNEYEAVK